MTERQIKRGDVVRKSEGRRDFYGTAYTTQSRRSTERVRVEWYPDFGTWEDAADLTVIDFLERAR